MSLRNCSGERPDHAAESLTEGLAGVYYANKWIVNRLQDDCRTTVNCDPPRRECI